MKKIFGFMLFILEIALFIYGAITISNTFMATLFGICAILSIIWCILNRKRLLK